MLKQLLNRFYLVKTCAHGKTEFKQVEKDVRASNRILVRVWEHFGEEDRALIEQKKMLGKLRKNLLKFALNRKLRQHYLQAWKTG